MLGDRATYAMVVNPQLALQLAIAAAGTRTRNLVIPCGKVPPWLPVFGLSGHRHPLIFAVQETHGVVFLSEQRKGILRVWALNCGKAIHV